MTTAGLIGLGEMCRRVVGMEMPAIPGISRQKDQETGDVKDLSLRPWRTTANTGKGSFECFVCQGKLIKQDL